LLGAIVALAIACGAVFWANELLRWIIPTHHHDGSCARGC
jgi:hypothetical protein